MSAGFRRMTRSVGYLDKSSPLPLSAVFGPGRTGSKRRQAGSGPVALDGKTARGSGDRASGTEQLHLVEAWACGQELMLRQRRSEGGSNEIEAIPRLLEVLTLEGCIVTIDAMGCQTDIAEAILGAEADYVLRVKDNQESLRSDIGRLFERHLARGSHLAL